MLAKKNSKEEFIFYSGDEEYWKCFYFVTTYPMNRLVESEKNNITVNGRNSPFASLFIDLPNLVVKQHSLPIFIWYLNFPIYAIHRTTIRIEHDDIFHPPIPNECWRFYERHKKRAFKKTDISTSS